MNIPNTLTFFRIFLVPIFAIVFTLPVEWANLAACMVFTLAALTDLLDGFFARKLKQTSKLGEFLDPVADKFMVTVVLVLLITKNPGLIIAIPAAIIIGRELTISALREWMAEIGARSKVAVSILGKIKTITQMVALILLVYHDDFFNIPTYRLGLICLYIATSLTLWSMFQYITTAWAKIRE